MIQTECNESKFVKQKVPLTWMKLLDRLKETQESFLSIATVLEMAQDCNISSVNEVHMFLRFMSNTGYLTWMEDSYLR